ncbi:MAG: hypothetical protein KAR31_03995, partial [Candidatus Omnitrophica bacterium]|nr:hypothetical protein [Candidatus Omnitrophota bacterium]
MKRLLLPILILLVAVNANATTWYIRKDGGTASQCDGTTNASVAGTPNCALNHPNWVFPARGESTARKAAASDTVIISSGSYRIGCQNVTNCRDSLVNLTVSAYCDDSYSSWCYMGSIPSNVTIIGCTASGCASLDDRPELWGAGRVDRIFDVSGSSGVTIKDFELTDHDDCGYAHAAYGCGSRDSSELTANRGIYGTSATNLTLTNLKIHGMFTRAFLVASVNGLTITGSNFDYNAYAGIDNDLGSCKTCGWTGTISITDTTVKYNGCVEDNPGYGTIKSEGCYSQSQTGYGDGIGMNDTEGNWVLTNVDVSYNVSDGLDLLYMNQGNYPGPGTVTIKRSRFEGNGGNQIKVPNELTVEDSFILGNCNYFNGQAFTCTSSTCGNGFDHCRPSGQGHAIAVSFKGDDVVPKIVSSTILSNGDVGILTGGECTSGTNIDVFNNVLIGGWHWNQPDKADLFYNGSEDCNANFNSDYNVCDDQWKTSECGGANDTTVSTANVKFTGTITQGDGANSTTGFRGTEDYIDELTIQVTSPAVGLSDETVSGADSLDYNSFDRGASWDAGAYEYGTTGQGGGAADCTAQTISNCDVVLTSSGSSDGACESGYSGACEYDCTDGVWSLSSNSCTIDTCDNGSIDAGEDCDTDGPLLGGETCASQGYSGCSGSLACTVDTCLFDYSGCVAIACQDSCVDTGEECDDGNATEGDGCSSICETENVNYELFLNYTETDTPGQLTITTHDVEMVGITHNADNNVKYDFGATYFGDFVFRFKVTIDDCNDNGAGEDGGAGFIALSESSYDDLKELEDSGDGISFSLGCLSSAARHTWKIVKVEGGGASDTFEDAAPTLIRYIELERSGTTYTAKIYSDISFTTLLDTLTLTATAT